MRGTSTGGDPHDRGVSKTQKGDVIRSAEVDFIVSTDGEERTRGSLRFVGVLSPVPLSVPGTDPGRDGGDGSFGNLDK